MTDDQDDPHLTIGDFRQLYCVKGARKAFHEAGLDFHDFIRNGAKASALRGHGYDAVIDRTAELVRTRDRD